MPLSLCDVTYTFPLIQKMAVAMEGVFAFYTAVGAIVFTVMSCVAGAALRSTKSQVTELFRQHPGHCGCHDMKWSVGAATHLLSALASSGCCCDDCSCNWSAGWVRTRGSGDILTVRINTRHAKTAKDCFSAQSLALCANWKWLGLFYWLLIRLFPRCAPSSFCSWTSHWFCVSFKHSYDCS